jgi:hypothetical protein
MAAVRRQAGLGQLCVGRECMLSGVIGQIEALAGRGAEQKRGLPPRGRAKRLRRFPAPGGSLIRRERGKHTLAYAHVN